MCNRNLWLAAAAVAVALGTAACGSSGSTAAAHPASHPTSAATPAKVRSAGALNGDQLRAALLDASSWGSGWTNDKGDPAVTTTGLGAVADIPSLDCWNAVYSGSRTGSLTAVGDVVDSGSGDIAFQDTYQFRAGDAAIMLNTSAKRIEECGTFKHTDDDNIAYTVQADAQPFPGLGDQATKAVVRSVSSQNNVDVMVDLCVRYGDVVIDVGYESSLASTAESYDLAGKAKAIAAELGVAAGS